MKRHEMLGLNLHDPLDEVMKAVAMGMENSATHIAQGKPNQEFPRFMQFEDIVIHASLEHLGYGPIPNLKPMLEQGVDRAVEYFFGDWWRKCENDSIRLDKSRPDRALSWFGVLQKALLLGGLTGKWGEVAKICSWFDATIEAEFQGGLIDDSYQQLFLCIASKLAPTPMTNVEQILTSVRAAKSKPTKLLYAAWQSVMDQDQKSFNKAFKESVSHFAKSGGKNLPNVNFWLALDQSAVWLIAEREGLSFPPLPDKLDASVLRRQTIGLN